MSAPRLGFLGLGWIGAMRLDAVAAAGTAEIAALCEPVPGRLDAAGDRHAVDARFREFGDLLDRAGALRLDGLVIATPNALHADQCIAALERGLAVFCQKPLAIDAREARRIADAARDVDRLAAVDYSYRFTDGAAALRSLVRDGALGTVFHVDAVFHNAFGPDKEWCLDPARAGGGALIDLGVHQLDLPLWLLGFPVVRDVRGHVFRRGSPCAPRGDIDDFANARIVLDGGAVVQLAVSWNAHAGRDCVFRTTVLGTAAGAELRNVDGSFYDFELVRFDGRSTAVLGRESRDWLGRGILDWVERLRRSPRFDPAIENSVTVAGLVDAIYGRTG